MSSSPPPARVLLTLHTLLLLLLLGARSGSGALHHWGSRAGEEEPFCYPFNRTCGPITPSSATRYEAHLEHTDLIYNMTSYLEEFYDYEADVLAVIESSDTQYIHTIFFYALNKIVVMYKDRGMEEGHVSTTCQVEDISHDSWTNPFTGQDNTTHLILAPSQALLMGGDFRYSWIENNTQRGMPCNRWDACFTIDVGTFYVEYEWSDPTYVLEDVRYPRERPVRMHMTGLFQPPQGYYDPLPIDSIYHMALFDDNPLTEDIRWAFEIPSGVYCSGLPAGKDPPNAHYKAYSMRIEVTTQISTSPGQEYVFTTRRWYDLYNMLTRSDGMPNPSTSVYPVAGMVEVALIKDYRSKVQYVVDKALGNCTTMELTTFDTISTPDGRYRIKNPLMLTGVEIDRLTYHGTKYARGLPCDVWVGYLDIESDDGVINDAYLYEIYFLKTDWTEEAGATVNKQPVPVLLKFFQDYSVEPLPEDLFVNLQENIYKFEEETSLMTVYDITPCFSGHDHIRRFQMAFPGTYRDNFDSDPEQFTSWVHNGIVTYLSVPSIRLQQLEIEYVESSDRLISEFALVDRPQVDMDYPPYVGKPLEDVVEQLQNVMDDMIIFIIDDDGHPLTMRPIEDSLMEMFEDGCYSRHASSLPLPSLEDSHPAPQSNPSLRYTSGVDGGEEDRRDVGTAHSAAWAEMRKLSRSNDEKKYTPGDMAGMAVGMLVLGLLLGTVVMLVALKKMGLSNDIEFIPMSSRRQ